MLDLPLRAFWLMSNNITRLSAEEDIRRLSVTAAAPSEKGFKQVNEQLRHEMGEVFVKHEHVEAEEGLNELRKLQSQMTALRG